MSKPDRPRLLILTSSFPAEADDETCGYLREFAAHLASAFEITVLAPRDRKAGEWKPATFNLHRSTSFLPGHIDPFQASHDLNRLESEGALRKFFVLLSLTCFFFKAVKLARHADVICSHWMVPSGFIGAVLARTLRKPHVVVEHSGALHLLLRMRMGKTLAGFIAANSNRIATVSDELKHKLTQFVGVSHEKVCVIPMGISMSVSISHERQDSPCFRQRTSPGAEENGADVENAAGSPAGGCALNPILFIGRLAEIKGVVVLLKAVSLLQNSTNLGRPRVIIAGDGELRQNLDKAARTLGVDAAFVGSINRHEKDQLLAACNVVVIPSLQLSNGRTEGMPVVCMEALAAGRPVIASRVGGLPEIIEDGQNGLLFDHGDHRMLAELLSRVLGDSDLRRRLGANARTTSDSFRWPVISARYAEILNHAIDCHRRQQPAGRSTSYCVATRSR